MTDEPRYFVTARVNGEEVPVTFAPAGEPTTVQMFSDGTVLVNGEPVTCRQCWHGRDEHDDGNSWICTARDTNDEPCLCTGFNPYDDGDTDDQPA